MSSPLKGIRVLELGQFIAGPYAGLQLADLGARVIKVERPRGGDAFREFGFNTNAPGYSHNFCAFNRNKLSITLDLNSPRGQEAFRRMAREADVVLENFRPGVMKRLGLDHETLRADNPRLVYCSIAGFAEDGPYGERPAYDAVGQALSGLMSLFVDPKDPRTLGPTLSDQVSGMQACMAVLAALYERERMGRIENYEALVQVLRPVFGAKPREVWAERLAAHDVPAAVVHSIPEAMEDPEVKHLDMFHELSHPSYGKLTAMHRAARIGGKRESEPLPPPALGEHTEQVLLEFGFAAAEISGLRAAGAI